MRPARQQLNPGASQEHGMVFSSFLLFANTFTYKGPRTWVLLMQ